MRCGVSDVDKVAYWIDMADYDLETAKAMLFSQRYLYVGFMCHQAIEKVLKAVYSKQNPDSSPPYIHNLTKLAKAVDVYCEMTERKKDFMDYLEPLNIEARYPSDKEQVLASLSHERCLTILEETDVLYQWIKTKL